MLWLFLSLRRIFCLRDVYDDCIRPPPPRKVSPVHNGPQRTRSIPPSPDDDDSRTTNHPAGQLVVAMVDKHTHRWRRRWWWQVD